MGERHSTFVLQAVECTVGRGYGVCVGVCVCGGGWVVFMGGVCVSMVGCVYRGVRVEDSQTTFGGLIGCVFL